MRKLTAFYFTGTGNTCYVTEKLCGSLSDKFEIKIHDISQNKPINADADPSRMLLFAFPIYGSCPPLPMRRFIYRYAETIKGKEIIIIATQFMFSGDGAASLGRSIEKLGGRVNYAEHFNMPNNLADCKAFKIRNGKEIESILKKADKRISAFARKILAGEPFRRGFNPFSRAVGYFSQRKWWRKCESGKRGALRIADERCVGCGVCARNCPVGNIRIEKGRAVPRGDCALCYRCVNLCPKKAIVLVGKEPPAVQYKGPPLIK